ncbi:8-demethylnovobiocic acid C(8)-methyltransferase [Acaryochloris thomasi RCC1774]|uniref:8-demethylnovobiocic acid C(8)-methyltransferase n=1 Tax=Acaryochloris thomasi RCC1774 TaxID=1764569 RepID=A0A2W1JMZ5_9CYAN|nr:class I SAM-dependent methyltransferase [Acaryochloris thomasi]PZD74710.1 8-demethylnovobiocic acid C(8)-methyltransferase [Acaryochloris thomasi RCC1774]
MGKLQRQILQTAVRQLIGDQNQHLYHSLDWAQACAAFQQRELQYPDYYAQDFHGIKGGYLTPVAAVTYDAVTALASPPSEEGLRHQLIQQVAGQPRHILDLGCGTGSTTVKLKQAFPTATVIGVDLSPYMLVMASRKAQAAGISIEWQQGLAETTHREPGRFDLITASMLFHELPPSQSQLVLREALRLCKPGGQVLTLDGNQTQLRRLDWLIQLFREPYSKLYAAESVEDWMQSLGYRTQPTRYVGWIHQINVGYKP